MNWLAGRFPLPCTSLFFCVVLAGCSSEPKRTDVQGKVTIKGVAPNITGLRISFIGPDNNSVTALISPNGDYTANVQSGANLVVVAWQPPDDQNHFQAAKPKGGRGPAAPTEEPDANRNPMDRLNSPIPLRYALPATSGLNCVIDPDKTNTFNVDLVD